MKSLSYIVGYKDHENAPVRYFGVFASESVADFFKASLPLPLKGGWCRTVMLQPFGAHDGYQISQSIVRERDKLVTV